MKFGHVDVKDSGGSMLSHAIRAPGINLKKGHMVGVDDIAALKAAGIETIICASFESGDVSEDAAAARVAQRLCGAHVALERAFTGRCNIIAARSGLVVIDRAVVDGVNAEDEAITVATVSPFQMVESGDIVAAVKVIPFAVTSGCLERSLEAAFAPAVAVAPFRPLRLGVISTLLPGLKRTVVDKTIRNLEERIAPAGAVVRSEQRIMHNAQAFASTLRAMRDVDLIVVFGATAITDRRDVVPVGITMAGGGIDRLGMPVDPGNLLLLGRTASQAGRRSIPIIGAPGCARSVQESSFDLVLRRFLVGLDVTVADLRVMGVGGLMNQFLNKQNAELSPAHATPELLSE